MVSEEIHINPKAHGRPSGVLPEDAIPPENTHWLSLNWRTVKRPLVPAETPQCWVVEKGHELSCHLEASSPHIAVAGHPFSEQEQLG